MKMKAKPLNQKQAAFAREYVVDCSAKHAAIRAGYAEKSASQRGYQLLQIPNVKMEIDRLTQEKAMHSGIKAEDNVDALVKIVRASICDVMAWGMKPVLDEDGLEKKAPDGRTVMVPYVKVFDSHTLPTHTRDAIASVNVSDKGTITVKMHDKLAAIEKLMRHLGMFEPEKARPVDGLALLIASAQGTALPIATRRAALSSSHDDAGDGG